jgi:hypothetical protein
MLVQNAHTRTYRPNTLGGVGELLLTRRDDNSTPNDLGKCCFPAKILIDASENADLMVVGSRGGGGFGALFLGSVSSQVVHHAKCPVVVVPTGR